MLRGMRVVGIITFAGLTAWSAYSIRSMYRTGELYEEYNTDDRAMTALLAFSVIGLGGLGYLEAFCALRASRKRGFRCPEPHEDEVDGTDTTSIYCAPKSVDDWASKQRRTKPRNRGVQVEFSQVWMRFLKFGAFCLPLVYSLLLAFRWDSLGAETSLDWLFRGYLITLLVCSAIAAVGIMHSRIWGQVYGYVLSVLNLLLFPYGTAIGLILLISLVGAAQWLDTIKRRKLPGPKDR